jgi:hypothetical protein
MKGVLVNLVFARKSNRKDVKPYLEFFDGSIRNRRSIFVARITIRGIILQTRPKKKFQEAAHENAIKTPTTFVTVGEGIINTQ